MAIAFVMPDLGHVIERCVPGAVIYEDWSQFLDAAGRADCVIVAFPEPAGDITEERLRKLCAVSQPSLILVTRPEGAGLELLGRITYSEASPFRIADRRTRAVAAALASSPRTQLAERLLGTLVPDKLSAGVVREVLFADVPVNAAQLAGRLGRKVRTLRSAWDQEGRLLIGCTLHGFIRRGRYLRAVEALGRGLTLLEAALMLDIDVTTLQRDLYTFRRDEILQHFGYR